MERREEWGVGRLADRIVGTEEEVRGDRPRIDLFGGAEERGGMKKGGAEENRAQSEFGLSKTLMNPNRA